MKFSRYNHFLSFDGNIYLYNILTTSIAQLDKQTANLMAVEDIDALSEEVLDGLIAEGFIVDDGMDETLQYQYFCNSIKYGLSARSLTVTLIPTYNCNLACPYCIQGSAKKGKKMTCWEVDACLNFIKNKINESKSLIPIKKLFISLFGGEPMMCKSELIYFCEKTSELASVEGLEIGYDMTSNMTLLDESMLEMIEKYQISVQVSIDGTREEHDRRRIKRDGKGTYDIILANLAAMCERGLKHLITIRLNVDNENVEDAEKIFDSVKKYSDDIYFGFLTSLKGVNDSYTEKCVEPKCFSDIVSEKLNNVIEKNGYVVPQSFGKKAPCAMTCQNKFFIDCNLNVYKCELLINRPECRVGYIDLDGNFTPTGGFFNQMSFSPFDYDECRECKFLPLCGGGCPAQKYADLERNDGELRNKNCSFNEELLDAYLKDYIKRL